MGWLAYLDRLGLGGILADDMGLGKTVQLLALLVAEQQNVPAPERFGPTLLICPMSLVGNWQREAARFAPSLRVHVHHGGDRLDADGLATATPGHRPRPDDVRAGRPRSGCLEHDGLGPRRPRRGAGDQELGHRPEPCGSRPPGALAICADRDTDREPARRALDGHGLREPRAPGLGGELPPPIRRSRSNAGATTTRPNGFAGSRRRSSSAGSSPIARSRRSCPTRSSSPSRAT